MSRRARIDPETARVVEERLQWLLQEHGPHAPVASSGPRLPEAPVGPRRRAVRSDVDLVGSRAQRSRRRLVTDESGSDDLTAEAVPRGAELIGELTGDGEAVRIDSGEAVRIDSGEAVGIDSGGAVRIDSGQANRSDPTAGGPGSRMAAAGTTRRWPRPDRPPREPGPPNPPSPTAALLTAVTTFRRPHLVIVGVLVALAILLAGWAVLRARPVAVAVTPPPVAVSRSGSAPASDSGSRPVSKDGATPSPSAPSVVVHVLGAVKKPGLVTLTAGSRVQDALDAAGGLTRKADPGELNLAQQLADGQQILVGTKGKPSGELRTSTAGGGSSSGSGTGSGGAGGSGQPVNLNTASQAELEELPGVGPVMAGKIIAWRTEHGRFSRVEELQEIDGVGPKTYAKLAPLCQV